MERHSAGHMVSVTERDAGSGLGAWAIVDQGIVSAGNFLTNVLLARWLVAVEYGTFVLIFGAMIFFNALHSSLVAYPLSVNPAVATPSGLRRLAGTCIYLTVLLWVPLAAMIAAACAALDRVTLIPWVVVALLLWEVQETLRRILMARLRHRDAVFGDILSYLGQALGIWALASTGNLTLKTTFCLIAVTSASAALLQLCQIGPAKVSVAQLLACGRKFWGLGRWALLAGASSAFTTQVFPWILALRGVREAALFQALMNLVAFARPVAAGIGNLVVPAVAQSEPRYARRITSMYMGQGLVILLPYLLGLFLFPQKALFLAYGSSSNYLGQVWPLRLLVAAIVIGYCAQVLGSYRYGMRDGVGILASQLISSLSVVLLGLPLAYLRGASGAAWGVIIANAVLAVTLLQRNGKEAGMPSLSVQAGAGRD